MSSTQRSARHVWRLLFLLTLGSAVRALPAEPPPAPPLAREFRGVWIATVSNIDWPSRPALPVATQQTELRALLDLARKLNLNAVLLQVRPACDAFYPSPHEPWSEYLTGRMGRAPWPAWDPLAFAVAEAHARGLELHAWFNPFRARAGSGLGPADPTHVSRRQPHLVRTYGKNLWLDPGESDVREHARRVIVDVVRRYDIDGIHLDDYFYPYPEKRPSGANLPFDDARSWDRYQRAGGRLERNDWRRENVNRFIRELGADIHAEKPWVKFGISPFGIWRPGNPAPIRGLDAFEALHADARQWFRAGWVDYLAPQLYWPVARREQSFPLLLKWWAGENLAHRHLWPGLASARVGEDRNAQEIVQQVRLARAEAGVGGVLFWNASSLRTDKGGVATALRRESFTAPALPPASPWLGTNAPAAPRLVWTLNAAATRLTVNWTLATNPPVRWLALQSRIGNQWLTEILPASSTNRVFERKGGETLPEEVRLTPVSRTGIEGEPARWRREPVEPPRQKPPRSDTRK